MSEATQAFKNNDLLFDKVSQLSLLFETESVDKIKNFLEENLTGSEILNIRFTSSQKTLLIKLVLLESNQFPILFDIIKKKLTNEELISLVNLPDDNSNTPLLYAAFKGDYEKADILIKHGAKVEMRNFMGLSVMHMAAQGDKPNMLIFFKEKYNFSVLDRDFPGNTPLHWACHMAQENSINFLLTWMNDVNVLDRKGQTPLHLGIYKLRPKMIKKLIKKGADVNLKDFTGRSVMDILNDQKMRVPNFKKVLKVINNTEQFNLFVYPEEEKTNKNNNNYKELFSGFNDDDLKEKLIDKNTNNNNANSCKNSETSKSCLTYHKIFNSLMFICLHVIFELLIFFFVLAKLGINDYYKIFWILIITLFILFYCTNKSDPGFLEPKDNLTWLQMVENKMNINEYCPYCRVKKSQKVKHCHLCKKCIKGFDHHCNWIDNCVGENNKVMFLCFVGITLLNLIFNLFVGINALNAGKGSQKKNINNNAILKNIETVIEMNWIFDYNISELISILITIVSGFFTIPVFYVFYVQIKGLFKNNDNDNEN